MSDATEKSLFVFSGGATPQAYLNETLDRIRQEKTWGNDPLRVQLCGSNVETLLQEYLRQNQRVETGETTRIPVLLVELPPPPERRSATFLPATFLEQLGDPAARVREPADSKTYRLERLLRAFQVELIVITKFHHLLSAKRQQPLANEFNWVLELIMHQVKEIPVVVAGDEVLVRRLLGREFAIARRFFSITVPDTSQEAVTQTNLAE